MKERLVQKIILCFAYCNSRNNALFYYDNYWIARGRLQAGMNYLNSSTRTEKYLKESAEIMLEQAGIALGLLHRRKGIEVKDETLEKIIEEANRFLNDKK